MTVKIRAAIDDLYRVPENGKAELVNGAIVYLRFVVDAPLFAVEVRSENDYGASAERDMMVKRADYFAAGTQVVWDVDLLSADVIKKYNAADPNHPIIFRRGEIADADAVVPGWRMPVDLLFV